MADYVVPSRSESAFTCPHCGVFAHQHWYSNPPTFDINGKHQGSAPIATSICQHCDDFALWHLQQMVHPNRGSAPLPNPDMPTDVQKLYEEAASIATLSPRGAGALLRLAIQNLCMFLGGKGKDINDDIGELVADGLQPKIQKAFDVVRITGNNAVHPGVIDTDDPAVVAQLFGLTNVIVESMITMPNRIDQLYDGLPQGALDAIDRRDQQE